MRVTEEVATPAHVASALAYCGTPGNWRAWARPICVGAIGLAACAAGYAFAPLHALGVLLAVAGCVVLAFGAFDAWQTVLTARFSEEAERDAELVLRRGRVVVVEIDAARAFSAEPIDDDVPAVVLADGMGGGVYINAAELDDADPEGLGPPRSWRLVLSARAGVVLEASSKGDPLAVEDGPDGLPASAGARIDAVVLPHDSTTTAWRKALGSQGP
jgi:hypothetical protein